MPTPVYRLPFPETENELYVKRDDLYPLSFGGNKARKAELFWQDLEAKKSDHVVTYGTSSSNHCRVIANLAAMHGLPCTIISPEQKSEAAGIHALFYYGRRSWKYGNPGLCEYL